MTSRRPVYHAALQRAASVQDLDVGDVAKALATPKCGAGISDPTGTPLARVTLVPKRKVGQAADADDVEPTRLSTVPTDGVPHEALQRAVTEAEKCTERRS